MSILVFCQKGDTTLRTTLAPASWFHDGLLPLLPRTSELAIYDLRALAPEELLSVSTLLGLVNRGPARVYGIENADDEFWLAQLDDSLPCTRPAVENGDVLAHLLRTYHELVQGLVIYDPALIDSRNVASTLASLRAGLVVSPEQAGHLQNAPYSLPILADLRVHSWKSRLQAYTWAYKHLLAACSPDLVAGLDPSICGTLRSFLVTQRVFTCWLDARKIIPERVAGWRCERGLFKRMLAHFHAGTLHLGWFVSEPFGIRLTSRAAILTLASDHCTNLAVWSSLPVQSIREAPALTEETGSTNIPQIAPGKEAYNAQTTYLSFTMSDGDNLQYCQHYLLRLWRDPARGSLPIGWTIAPALWYTMPHLAAFYRNTLSPNDVLIAGPSGIAYMLPSHWPRRECAAFLEATAASLQTSDLTLLQVLDSRSWLSWFNMRFLNPRLQKLFASGLATRGLLGIFSGAGGLFPSWGQRASVPIYQNLGLALNPQRAQSLVQSSIARGTRFINLYVFAWKITPSDLLRIVQNLDGNVRVVSPARLIELLQQAEKR